MVLYMLITCMIEWCFFFYSIVDSGLFCFIFFRQDEAAALYLRCAEAWVHGDEPGRAADYFGRSAKLVKDTDEDAAAERYILASKVRKWYNNMMIFTLPWCCFFFIIILIMLFVCRVGRHPTGTKKKQDESGHLLSIACTALVGLCHWAESSRLVVGHVFVCVRVSVFACVLVWMCVLCEFFLFAEYVLSSIVVDPAYLFHYRRPSSYCFAVVVH